MRTFTTLLIILFSVSLQANTWFVKSGSTGNGSSWETAFGKLTDALERAEFGDEIWVAKGTYTPSLTDRNASFEVVDGIKLYGGFIGTEKALEQRDWVKNNTILSGEIGSPHLKDDNSYTVLLTINVSEETLIDGFTITNGYANGIGERGDLERCGGGWFNNGEYGYSNPVVKNCIFTDNFSRDGAAIYNYAKNGTCEPMIENCQFINNKADLDGGAMYNDCRQGVCNPSLKDCRFTKNEATYGGGILNYTEDGESAPSIIGCSFQDNIGYVRGGSIYNSDKSGGECTPEIVGTYFSDNRATVGKDIYESKMVNKADNTVVSQGKITKL